jgi:transcriptional regulator with XRE-family HTH domain
MDINEIKKQNLIRLSKKYHVEEPAKLARILKTSIQHASQLLLGKSAVGKVTTDKLCRAWKIDPEEFVRVDTQDNDKVSPETTSQENDWKMKHILDGMQKQIDGLQKQVDALLVGIKSLEDSKKQIKTDISSINNRLFEAANSGELKKLG